MFGTVTGPAGSILVAERVALNLMQVGGLPMPWAGLWWSGRWLVGVQWWLQLLAPLPLAGKA